MIITSPMSYHQILAATTNACLPLAAGLRSTVLALSSNALASMGPLSLSAASSERPAFMTSHVLNQIDKFMQDMAL